MKRHLAALVFAIGSGVTNLATAQIGVVLYQENFNGVVLGPSVNERQGTPSFALSTRLATDPDTSPRPNAFTHTPPAGWMVDNNFNNFGFTDLDNPNYAYGFIVGNTGVPNQGSAADGVDEWEGWSFANKTFWASVDDQNRSQFTNAVGTIAVADSDEYDDLGDGLGGQYMNTGLTTAAVNVAAHAGGIIDLEFDSSWRPESFDDAHTANPNLAGASVNNQTAMVWASFDGASPPELVDLWHSDPLDALDFKGDATNEHPTYQVAVPAGASTMKLTFAYLNAGNDWWWGIDNLELSQGGNPAFWTEDFESLTLGPSVNERIANVPTIPKITAANNDPNTTPRPNSFTHTPPAGWNIDNSGIGAAAIGDNNIGVFEWEGWSFTTRDFSVFSAQGSMSGFTKGDGPFAMADSDEFDDLGSPPRPYSTILESPTLDITGQAASSLLLQFDSAWRAEGNQAAEITVDYGGGEVQVLRWESDSANPNFHGDNLNETVLVDLMNPAGATSAKIRFKYLNGANNWFWAIDNIQVGLIPEPSTLALSALAVMAAGLAGRRRR